MSCGDPHETDCSEVLDHLYEYLDREMPERDCEKFQEHFDECSPCFEKYGLEREVKKLVKRCCGQDDVPTDLRAKVMSRIEVIRQGQGPDGAGAAESAAAESGAGAAGSGDAGDGGSDSGASAPPAAGKNAGTGVGRSADKNPA